VAERYPYASASHGLVPGEWLCVVTDGVTEARDPEDAFYGSTRLEELLRRSAQAEPRRVTALVSEDVRAFARDAEQSDDLTLLCLRWSGASGR
jgi:serine phosphatase RsbU (regulator of sigma subunit)